MHVDDRLATVLGARVESAPARRIQYRQLLDLVGTASTADRDDQLDAAFVRLAALAGELPPEDRARALAEPGVRLRNPRLVALLAADVPAVALAAIRAARLDDGQWLDLIPALPLAARGLVRHRRDLGPDVEARLERLGIGDRGLPPVEGAVQAEPADHPAPAPLVVAAPIPAPPVQATPTPTEETPAQAPVAAAPPAEMPAAATAIPSARAVPAGDGIGALVRRIEAFRRSRQGTAPPHPANDAPLLPLGEREIELPQLIAFSFGTDPSGRIDWTDAPVPGMLVGTPLERADGGALVPVLRSRLPIRSHLLALAGAPSIEGEWLVDAYPDFDEAGRFTGYLGRCRRPAPAAPLPASEADRMRQVLHELKTPVNAIQGFAEVIQQQLFGPVPHEYRALAATVAGDAARLLAGFDELDRWARLDAGVLAPDEGQCDFAMIVAGLVHQLESFTAARSSGFSLVADPGEALVPLTPPDAERLAWRLLATCAGFACPGETLALELHHDASQVRLLARLPEALAAVSQPADAPTAPAAQAISAGFFGTAFTFRLLAAEARGAGGLLEFADGRALLTLPTAQGHGQDPAQDDRLTFDKGPISQSATNASGAGH